MARARLLLEATSTRVAARQFAEHEDTLSPSRVTLGKGLPEPSLAVTPSPVQFVGEGGNVEQAKRLALREGGVVYASGAQLPDVEGRVWLRLPRSRPLSLLVTACALLVLMVVMLSLVKLCTDLLTLVGPHLGA